MCQHRRVAQPDLEIRLGHGTGGEGDVRHHRLADYDTGGHDPADPVDQAIMATRRAIFPLHGLMP